MKNNYFVYHLVRYNGEVLHIGFAKGPIKPHKFRIECGPETSKIIEEDQQYGHEALLGIVAKNLSEDEARSYLN